MGRAGTVIGVFMTFAILIAAWVAVDIVEHGRPATKTEPAPKFHFSYLEMPDVIPCPQDGGYWCMTNDDYIRLNGAVQEARYLIDNPRRPVCNTAGCLCAMDEALK